MWLVISVFSFVQIYMLALSMTLYFVEEDCEYPANKIGWDVFLWILSRTIQYEVWTYPLIYIFWPRSLTKALRKNCCCFRKKVQRRKVETEERKSRESDEEAKTDEIDNYSSTSSGLTESDEEGAEEAESQSNTSDQKNHFAEKKRHFTAFLGSNIDLVEPKEPQSDLVRRSMQLAEERKYSSRRGSTNH